MRDDQCCEVPECDRNVYAQDLCGRHYKQMRRHGAVQATTEKQYCSVPGCGRTAATRGWCHGHYVRFYRNGDVRAEVPLARPTRDTCVIEDCDRGARSGGYCRTHLRRLQRHGDPLKRGACPSERGWRIAQPRLLESARPSRSAALGAGWPHDGSRAQAGVRAAPWRPLAADEVVHHRNGDRLDNRLENLELWTTAQPKGQRVEDKLAWAYAFLDRYDPEAASALGRDLDPHTGAPVTRESPLPW